MSCSSASEAFAACKALFSFCRSSICFLATSCWLCSPLKADSRVCASADSLFTSTLASDSLAYGSTIIPSRVRMQRQINVVTMLTNLHVFH